jgi:hypothetical protein
MCSLHPHAERNQAIAGRALGDQATALAGLAAASLAADPGLTALSRLS